MYPRFVKMGVLEKTKNTYTMSNHHSLEPICGVQTEKCTKTVNEYKTGKAQECHHVLLVHKNWDWLHRILYSYLTHQSQTSKCFHYWKKNTLEIEQQQITTHFTSTLPRASRSNIPCYKNTTKNTHTSETYHKRMEQ